MQSFDARSGMVLSNAARNDSPHGFTYDLAGRQTGTTSTTYTGSSGSPIYHPFVTTDVKAYDAQNHLALDGAGSCVGSNCTLTGVPGTPGGPWQFGWGASGHLRTAVDPDYTPEHAMLTLHWDGGSLLFASNTLNSTSTVLYLGGLGVMDAKGNLEVWDRDASGTQESAHSATWFSGWGGAPSYTIGGGTVTAGGHSGTVPTEVVSPMPGACLHNNTWGQSPIGGGCPVSDPFVYTPIQQPRSDGYAYSRRMGGGTYQRSLNFQGVRVYDNTSAQWLTPDFYAGTASDPMSQQPFMWNNNNPVSYSDPSGYCIEDACVGEAAATAALVEGVADIAAAAGDEVLATEIRSTISTASKAVEERGRLFVQEIKGLAKTAGAKGGAFARGITGFTKHGLNQMISRGGVGVANAAFANILRTASKAILQANGTLKIVSKAGMVVINAAGKVVTAAGKARVKL